MGFHLKSVVCGVHEKLFGKLFRFFFFVFKTSKRRKGEKEKRPGVAARLPVSG